MPSPPTEPAPASAHAPRVGATEIGGPYARYVLAVLTLVYVFNFLDRQILSILSERIKADLGLRDDQMGFLYGTAFAVFYALFGIPLGRLADVWRRSRLISLGLAGWSGMTALSGLARNFGQLAAARIGVGIGEASANPAAFSLLSDWFPAERRGTTIALYSSGVYVGAGLGLVVGGLVVQAWDRLYPAASAPLGLRGWQVAFFVVGLPGLLLSLWVATLREPLRGQVDGIFAPTEPRPFRAFLRELRAVLPPLTLLHLWLERAGAAALGANLLAAAGLALVAALLTAWIGSAEQWIALAIGFYATFSWGQGLRLRDAPSFELIFRTPSLRWAFLGFALLAFTGYGVGFWVPPFFMRVHGVSPAKAGLVVGGTAAVAGFLGVSLGGILSDRWRAGSPNGRLWVGILTAVLPLPVAAVTFTTSDVPLAFALNLPLGILTSLWVGVGATTVQDLVLPRMRATASAAYILVVTFVGMALGPYTVGRLSVALGDLRRAMLCALFANVLALTCLLLAMRHLARDESSRVARARAAGEPGL